MMTSSEARDVSAIIAQEDDEPTPASSFDDDATMGAGWDEPTVSGRAATE